MKKMMYLAVMVLALGLSACGNSSKKQAETTQDSTTVSVASAMTVEDVLAKAEESVGKEITVKGLVSHTCKHSGRRCFIVGADGKTSIRVEAKGDIGGNNKDAYSIYYVDGMSYEVAE